MLISLALFKALDAKVVNSRHDLPNLWKDDEIELTYYQSTELPKARSFSTGLAKLGQYRSGLRYVVNEDFAGALELVPDSVAGSLIPAVVFDNFSLEKSLVWKNKARMHHFGPGSPGAPSFSDMNKESVGTLTGEQLNELFCELTPDKEKNSGEYVFRPFTVLSMNEEVIMEPFTKDNFVLLLLGLLTSIGISPPELDIPTFSITTKSSKLPVDLVGEQDAALAKYYHHARPLRQVLVDGELARPHQFEEALFEARGMAYLPAPDHPDKYYKFRLVDDPTDYRLAVVNLGKDNDRRRSTPIGLNCKAPAQMSSAEYWLWKIGAAASFFVGVSFLYTAYKNNFKVPGINVKNPIKAPRLTRPKWFPGRPAGAREPSVASSVAYETIQDQEL